MFKRKSRSSFFTILSVYAEAVQSTPKDDLLLIISIEGLEILGPESQNDNGFQLLQFGASNQLCVTNTFKHKEVHMMTWQHPRTKMCYMIDFVLIKRQKDRGMVHDTRVFRSADCWTDHKLVKSKVSLLYNRVQNEVSR